MLSPYRLLDLSDERGMNAGPELEHQLLSSSAMSFFGATVRTIPVECRAGQGTTAIPGHRRGGRRGSSRAPASRWPFLATRR